MVLGLSSHVRKEREQNAEFLINILVMVNFLLICTESQMTHILPLKRCHYFVVFEADEEVDMKKDKVIQLNYFSLYFKGIYTVTTTGESADYTSRFGILYHDGMKDGYKYYKQLHTVEGTEGRYSYRDDEGVWGMRKSMLDERSSLRNLSKSEDLPHVNWEFDKNGDWCPAKEMSVTPGPPLLCKSVNISAPEAVSLSPEIVGKYLPTSDFSSGREIFKHESEFIGVFLQ